VPLALFSADARCLLFRRAINAMASFRQYFIAVWLPGRHRTGRSGNANCAFDSRLARPVQAQALRQLMIDAADVSMRNHHQTLVLRTEYQSSRGRA
jgi:hypothetical protein